MIRIATLGPAGTNHEMVTCRYMHFHDLADFEITLVDDFSEAVQMLRGGEVDLIVQCAVHPAASETMGAAFHEVFVVDCFIADSQELGILTRRDVEKPRSLGLLMPSTADYTDVSRWEEHRNIPSLPIIFDKLMAGEIDSGLVYTSYAEKQPDVLRVDEVIGSPDDVWIVYAKKRMSKKGGIVADKDGPFASELRRLAAGEGSSSAKVEHN